MNKKLYEIAVVTRHNKDNDTALIVPPTPFMAVDDNAATAQGVLLAAAQSTKSFDPSDIKVIVRPFL